MGQRTAQVIWMCAGLLLVGGCSAPAHDNQPLLIDSGEYRAAFDAALAATREADMPATLRDRRSGMIETAPQITASLLEPTAITEHTTVAAALENTTSFQRRRARMTFSPHDQPAAAPRTPDLLGIDGSGDPDLTRYGGALDLEIQVYLERYDRPGRRPAYWSRRLSTEVERTDGDATMPREGWRVVGRDRDAEARLRRAVIERLVKTQ